jgi:site-specific DNA-cytosine methylase
MRVLVACEFSGIVREAFKAKGHDVWSCDLLPTEIPGNHYQGDVFDIINDGFDLMIAHPPCTYLSFAATSSWNKPGR